MSTRVDAPSPLPFYRREASCGRRPSRQTLARGAWAWRGLSSGCVRRRAQPCGTRRRRKSTTRSLRKSVSCERVFVRRTRENGNRAKKTRVAALSTRSLVVPCPSVLEPQSGCLDAQRWSRRPSTTTSSESRPERPRRSSRSRIARSVSEILSLSATRARAQHRFPGRESLESPVILHVKL